MRSAKLSSPGSAALGHQVAALLDIEQAVPGVTVSPVRPELRVLGVLTATSGPLNPGDGDLDLTAGWGHGGQGGVTMPGKGKAVERPYTPAELAAIAESGLDAALLGAGTYDVYLNGKAFWSNIPVRRLGVHPRRVSGDQEVAQLPRKGFTHPRTDQEEARHVTDMVRRIAALLLMGPALDTNYAAVKQETYLWHPHV